jgi:hypothetical protein
VTHVTLDPAPGSAPGLVVCVGLPSDQIIEIAHLLRGRATVLATPDAEGARAVLANQTAPRRTGGAAVRRLGAQAERYDNPGPTEDRTYGRQVPEPPAASEGDNLSGAAPRTAPGADQVSVAGQGTGPAAAGWSDAERRSTALSAASAATSPGLPDGGAADRRGRFRPPSGSALAQPTPRATASGPRRSEAVQAAMMEAGMVEAAAGGRAAGGAGGRAAPAYGAATAARDQARHVAVATGPIPMIAPPTLAPLVAGPLLVDLAGREVTALGRRVYLSAREFDLLATLALEAGRVWSFAELTARVWQLPYLGDSDPVTSAIKRLRKRLAPVRDVEVASVRGVGYRLRVRV